MKNVLVKKLLSVSVTVMCIGSVTCGVTMATQRSKSLPCLSSLNTSVKETEAKRQKELKEIRKFMCEHERRVGHKILCKLREKDKPRILKDAIKWGVYAYNEEN